MQLLLIVIYILAQILGNGGSAQKSAPASAPIKAQLNYAILRSDCKAIPVDAAGRQFMEINLQELDPETDESKSKQSCKIGANTSIINPVKAVWIKKKEVPRPVVHYI
ncbi:MAG: hypothetical protein WC725_04550 [Patescibacteria group bacterium]|jgi:hypothetical protein